MGEMSNEDFAMFIREKAIAGDPVFQHRVGNCYYWGDGIERNYAEAVKWYKLSAEQGYADAQNNLAVCYQKGKGVVQDYEEALRLLNLSAEQGNAIAQNNLAGRYQKGEGVVQDYKEALRLLNLSAEQGNWVASYNLGLIYSARVDVEQDLEKAKECHEKALANADFSDFPAGEFSKKLIQKEIDEINAKLAEIESKAKAAREAERTEVFISYSHEDDEHIKQLRPHLKMLTNIKEINWWDDTKIKSGEEWDKEIKKVISKVKIAVLMTSANFFSSEYVWGEELPAILEAADKDGATILWVPVSACHFKGTGIEHFQSVVTDLKNPLDKRTSAERNEVYAELARRIEELFK